MYESDGELIRACRKGESWAWRAVLDRYERLVYSIPLNYGLSRDDASDIAQLTFTILLQSLDKLREDSRLGPWLATVARRHTWRQMERGRRESTLRKEDLSESATLPEEGEEDFAARWETAEWLNQGLSLISEPCRRLLLALYFAPGESSYAEVAERLGMPIGSIGPTRARCLKNLKEVLLKH